MPVRSNRRKRLARHTKKRTQTGGSIWNRFRTLPGIRYFTKKNMQKTATTQCYIEDIAVLSRYDKRLQPSSLNPLPSSIIPLSSENAQCLINNHKQKNTYIFAYYILNDQTKQPCPTYNLTYFDKNGNENTINDTDTDTDTSIGSILQVWPTNISPGLPPHVKYIIGKKYDDKVKEGQLVQFATKTDRPRLDVVVSALQQILDSIPNSANIYKVIKVDSEQTLNEITTVDNFIIYTDLEYIIKNINDYVIKLNTIPNGTCKTLETDKMFIAYRILSNALDTQLNNNTIPIYFYTYENTSDYIYPNEKSTKLKFVKLSSENIDNKSPTILPIIYKLDEPILYGEFVNNKPLEFILILKK